MNQILHSVRFRPLPGFFALLFMVVSCSTPRFTQQSSQENYQYHRVQKGDNIGKIANTYNLTETEIKKMNPGVDLKHLKPGQELKLPIRKKEEVVEIKEEKKESAPDKKQTLTRMALLLPLDAEQGMEENSDDQELYVDPNSIPFIHFYQGAKMALDSLARMGNNFQLTVLDTRSDSIKIARLIRDSLFIKNDLVIGVSVSHLVNQLAEAAKKYDKPLVITQHNSAAFLQSNPALVLTAPSVALQCELMSRYLYKKFSGERILLLHQDNKKENDLSALFSTALEIQHLKEGHSDTLKIKSLIYSPKLFEKNSGLLDKTRKNLIIIPSSDEAFVSPIITRLDSLDEYNLVICGLPTWENFETIDPQRLQNLHTHLFSSAFIDYNLQPIRNFRKTFLEQTKSDPVYHAYLGFSIAWLTGSILEKENHHLIRQLESADSHSLPVRFEFRSKSGSDGLENQIITILRFENYKLLPVE